MHKTITTSVSVMCPDTDGSNGIVRFPNATPARRTGVKERGFVLNRATAKKLTCPAGKTEHLYRDSQVHGFILRCYANGRRVWLVQYRDASGATRRVNIGDANVIEADEARERAKDILAEARKGVDPASRRREARQATKFGDLVEPYLSFAAGKQKESSLKEVRRNLVNHCASLNTTPIKSLDRATIAQLHDRISVSKGKTAANRVLAALSALFSWAMGKGLVESNPVIRIPRNAEAARERRLSDNEIRALWKVTQLGDDYSRIVRLLLLTGCRRSEVGDMQWGEIQNNLWTIPGERMKNHLPHEVPLSVQAQACLPPMEEGAAQTGFVFGKRSNSGFSGWSKAKARLDKAVGFDDWGLHDLRRTMSTRLHEAGVMPHVVEALLAHISGHKSGVAGVYNLALYRAQKREVLEQWSSMILQIVESK